MESITAEGEQGGEKDQEICAICLETPTDPHKLPCGHIFDLHCLLLFAVSSTPMQEGVPTVPKVPPAIRCEAADCTLIGSVANLRICAIVPIRS